MVATKSAQVPGEPAIQPGKDTVKPAKRGDGVPRQAAEPFNPLRSAKVKQADLILFTTQLAVMLDSGVALSDALDAIAEQAEQGKFKMIIMEVAETIKGGENFSAALLAYPKVFSSMFISMVKASEASGRMGEMLTVLSGYLSSESETPKRIKAAFA